MDSKSYIDFLLFLSKLLEEKQVIIIWRQQNGGIKLKVDLKEELERNELPYTEDDFLDYAFEVTALARLIAIGTPPILDQKDEEVFEDDTKISIFTKIDLIKQHFLNPDLIQYINLQSNSGFELLDELDYEIMTKRSKRDPNNIVTYSLLLNITTRNNKTSNVETDPISRLDLEVTNKDIDKIINILEKAKGALEKLSQPSQDS